MLQYVLAKKNYQTAPQEYEDAKKNYYVLNKGGVWFANFLEKQSRRLRFVLAQLLD